MGDCWSFRQVVFGLLVAVVKEEIKGKILDSGFFLIPLSPLSMFLFCLVLEEKLGRRWGGCRVGKGRTHKVAKTSRAKVRDLVQGITKDRQREQRDNRGN